LALIAPLKNAIIFLLQGASTTGLQPDFA